MTSYLYSSIFKGLRKQKPKCFRCGDCCLRICPELTKDEIKRIAKRLSQKQRKMFLQNLTKNPYEANPIDAYFFKTTSLTKEAWLKIPCMFLGWTKDGKAKCKIYKIRPLICKIFWCGKEKPDEPLSPAKYTYRMKIVNGKLQLG